jgi:CRP-like cAMP-binding protein
MNMLSYYFLEKKIKKGNVLFEEGSESDEIYFIKKGEIKFSKRLNVELLKNSSNDLEHNIKFGTIPQLDFFKTFEVKYILISISEF